MINKSFWDTNKKNMDTVLTKNLKTNILIIGSGITANTLAYLLTDKNIVIIDSTLGETTCKSTAKITYLQDIYSHIAKSKRSLYLNSQLDAVNLIKKIITINNIKCDFEKSIMYLFTNDKKEIKVIKKVENLFKNNNILYKKNSVINYSNIYNISINDAYLFNPTKYLNQIKKINKKDNVQYYKNRYVKHKKLYNCYEVTLDNNTIITCNKLIFACHYPPFLYPLFIPLKVKLDKSYIATITNSNKNICGINTNTPWQSFRFYKNNLIYLSNSHTVGKKLDNDKEANSLVSKIKHLYNEKVNYIWTNNDLISYDYLPIIGSLKKDDNSILVSTAYNTWGMTNGVIAAKLLKDIIEKKENKYIRLFNPHRFKNIKDYYNIIIFSLNNIFVFINSKINTNYSFYKNVVIKRINGVRYGIYTDEKNKKHVVLNKCPHMKCNLVFNELEHTWDCPCHASRFDIDGNIIKGPSVYNIKVKKSNK